MEGNCVFKFCFEDKKNVEWEILSWSRVEMCCSLNYCQHFPYKWGEFFDTNFGTSCLRRDLPTRWIFQEGYIEKEIATKWGEFFDTNFGTSCLRRDLPTRWIFQEGYIEKEIATKWGEFFDTNFGTSCLRRDSPTRWIFQEGYIEKEIATKWGEFFDTNFGTSCLRRDSPTHWIFQEGCIEKEIATVQNLWHFKKECLQNCLVQNHGDFDVNLHEWQARKQKRV
jgi:hypothetical protein